MTIAPLLAKALAIAVLVHGPCPLPGLEHRSCAQAPNTIYLEAIPPAWTREHELGHLVDYNFLTDQDRGMFSAIMHIRRPWIDPPNSPHEQFAEAVKLCARSARWPRSAPSGYGYAPTVYQHRKVCRWLQAVGERP